MMNLESIVLLMLLVFCIQKPSNLDYQEHLFVVLTDLHEDLLLQLQDTSNIFLWYSLSLHEEMKVQTQQIQAQLLRFALEVDENFDLFEELLSVNTFCSGRLTIKSSSLHMFLHRCISADDCARELFKPSKDSSSICICNEKNFFVLGFVFF